MRSDGERGTKITHPIAVAAGDGPGEGPRLHRGSRHARREEPRQAPPPEGATRTVSRLGTTGAGLGAAAGEEPGAPGALGPGAGAVPVATAGPVDAIGPAPGAAQGPVAPEAVATFEAALGIAGPAPAVRVARPVPYLQSGSGGSG